MTDLTTTQKIRIGLQNDLAQAEQQAVKTSDTKTLIALGDTIRWLKSKLSFYNSHHYAEYKRDNGETQ